MASSPRLATSTLRICGMRGFYAGKRNARQLTRRRQHRCAARHQKMRIIAGRSDPLWCGWWFDAPREPDRARAAAHRNRPMHPQRSACRTGRGVRDRSHAGIPITRGPIGADAERVRLDNAFCCTAANLPLNSLAMSMELRREMQVISPNRRVGARPSSRGSSPGSRRIGCGSQETRSLR
jgi:hypothetical protein